MSGVVAAEGAAEEAGRLMLEAINGGRGLVRAGKAEDGEDKGRVVRRAEREGRASEEAAAASWGS